MPSYGNEAGSGKPPPNSKSGFETARAVVTDPPHPMRARVDRGASKRAVGDIKKKLDEVVRTERAGIENQVKDPGDRAKKLEPLDQLPPDPAGRIKQLQDYNFTDPEAERLFQELMKSLQQQMLQPFMQGMKQSLQNMSA